MAESRVLGEVEEVRLEQGLVRYREVGDGDPVVFVHEFLVNGDLWRRVVPAIATRYRCIVSDLPLASHAVPMALGADLSPPGLARLELVAGSRAFVPEDRPERLVEVLELFLEEQVRAS